MKFYLLKLPDGKSMFRGPVAYVCADSSGRHDKPDPRAGHILLTCECLDEDECHRKIEGLIRDLKRLKTEASRWFKKKPQP